MENIADIETRFKCHEKDDRLHAMLELGGKSDRGRIGVLAEFMEHGDGRSVRGAAAAMLISIGSEEVAERRSGF